MMLQLREADIAVESFLKGNRRASISSIWIKNSPDRIME